MTMQKATYSTAEYSPTVALLSIQWHAGVAWALVIKGKQYVNSFSKAKIICRFQEALCIFPGLPQLQIHPITWMAGVHSRVCFNSIVHANPLQSGSTTK